MMPLPSARRLPLAALALVAIAGCTPEAHRYIRFPSLYNPGPAPYQRAEAIRHDPYPLNDVGPAIEGGRPREYQQPLGEVDRARLATTPPLVPRPVPPPTYPAPPPPVITGPPVITTPPTITTPYPPAAPAIPYQVQPRSPY